ncbi:Plant self-incompatibility protein S1 family [Striga hermonthica]|uniref:S-protein homolog n=1 Tax=Striga hermonthica TaxID=68872 RepID=A0A9N7NUP5_STRHE|nr:Plant self-incompatibility protein S1 family [Striga hermonthica]
MNMVLLTTVVVVLGLVTKLTPSQAINEKETVVLKNDIPGEYVTVHAYSSEDELGVHVLPYGANFTFHFRVNIWSTTKFMCDFTTSHGSGNYGVFNTRLGSKCHGYCLWSIVASGPCLLQVDNNWYCQPWKKPPSHKMRENLNKL